MQAVERRRQLESQHDGWHLRLPRDPVDRYGIQRLGANARERNEQRADRLRQLRDSLLYRCLSAARSPESHPQGQGSCFVSGHKQSAGLHLCCSLVTHGVGRLSKRGLEWSATWLAIHAVFIFRFRVLVS